MGTSHYDVDLATGDRDDLQYRLEYAYDVLGNRIARTAYGPDGTTITQNERYVPEGGRTLLEYDLTSGTAVLARQRLYGAGQLLAVDDRQLDGVIWILPDHKGSVGEALVSAAQYKSITYDAFGRVRAFAGPEGPSLAQRIDVGYLGMDYEPQGGLYHTGGGRYYDPLAGRYLSETPGGYRATGGANPYAFAGNTAAHAMRPAPVPARPANVVSQRVLTPSDTFVSDGGAVAAGGFREVPPGKQIVVPPAAGVVQPPCGS